ncbi:MAG: hypothetical protein AAFQ51_13635 [Pseudomonadota bacterium]
MRSGHNWTAHLEAEFATRAAMLRHSQVETDWAEADMARLVPHVTDLTSISERELGAVPGLRDAREAFRTAHATEARARTELGETAEAFAWLEDMPHQ